MAIISFASGSDSSEKSGTPQPARNSASSSAAPESKQEERTERGHGDEVARFEGWNGARVSAAAAQFLTVLAPALAALSTPMTDMDHLETSIWSEDLGEAGQATALGLHHILQLSLPIALRNSGSCSQSASCLSKNRIANVRRTPSTAPVGSVAGVRPCGFAV
jgi:hypothetical protein